MWKLRGCVGCKHADAPGLLRQIHDLQEQGCIVPLPAGDVVSLKASMAAGGACSLYGKPVPIDSCAASSEYSADYSCEHTFDSVSGDFWYNYGDGAAGRGNSQFDGADEHGTSSSWAIQHVRAASVDEQPWIEFGLGRAVELGAMSYSQRTNIPDECFKVGDSVL